MIRSVFSKILYAFGGIVEVGCVIHVIAEYIAEPTLCIGPSMKPTINANSLSDLVLTEHISTKLRLLKKSDIVIARSPKDPRITICKRITALEGDMVVSDVKINQEKIIKVPQGHVWLLGDNMDHSMDSRSYGPVPYGLILGRVCYKLFPLSEFGPMK